MGVFKVLVLVVTVFVLVAWPTEAKAPSLFGNNIYVNDFYLETPDQDELDWGDTSLTIEFWIFVDNVLPEEEVRPQVVHKRGSVCLGGGYLFPEVSPWYYTYRIGSSDGLYDGCGNAGLISYTPIEDWVHMALVIDKENSPRYSYLYVNGKWRHGFGINPVEIETSNLPLQVGREFRGRIDEIRISTVNRYRVGNGTFEVPTEPFVCDEYTVVLWHFDEVEGSTVYNDSCGYNNQLTQPQNTIYLPVVLH